MNYMKWLAYPVSIFIPFLLCACSEANVDRIMEDYLWEKRVVIVFAPSGHHPAFTQQNFHLADAPDGITARDLVVWRVIDRQYVSVDEERKAQLSTPPFYEYFQVSSDDFAFVLLGKDGTEKLRSDVPVTRDELFRIIDAMPMRQREMQSR